MATTFLDLTNDVLKRLNEVTLTPNNFTAPSNIHMDVQNAVNSALNRLYRDPFQWPFQCKKFDLTCIVGEGTYQLPANSKSVAFDTFVLVRDVSLNVNRTKLKWVDYEEFLETVHDEEEVGTPRMVIRNRDLSYTLYPTPDKPYKITFDHYEYPEPLTEWDNEIKLPDFFRWVLQDGAMFHVLTFRGALEEAAAYNTLYEEGVKEMRALYVNRYEYVRSSQIRR